MSWAGCLVLLFGWENPWEATRGGFESAVGPWVQFVVDLGSLQALEQRLGSALNHAVHAGVSPWGCRSTNTSSSCWPTPSL